MPIASPPAMPATAGRPAPPVPGRAVLPALPEGSAEPLPGTLNFRDFVAGLNPLHHLPVVGTIYRAVTGENLAAPMRVLGGALLGGPVGFASALAVSVVEEIARGAPAAPAAAPPRAVAARPGGTYGRA